MGSTNNNPITECNIMFSHTKVLTNKLEDNLQIFNSDYDIYYIGVFIWYMWVRYKDTYFPEAIKLTQTSK